MKTKLKKFSSFVLFTLVLGVAYFESPKETKAQTGGCPCYFSFTYGCDTGGSQSCGVVILIQ
jgi:hypothetical protein